VFFRHYPTAIDLIRHFSHTAQQHSCIEAPKNLGVPKFISCLRASSSHAAVAGKRKGRSGGVITTSIGPNKFRLVQVFSRSEKGAEVPLLYTIEIARLNGIKN
jgi:hypothetical protein